VSAEFAPSGTLRAAINHGNQVLAARDAKTGKLSGVSVDLARELGRRLGLKVELIPFDAAGKVTAAIKSGAWDLAFLAIDPERAQEIDYSAAYMELEGTYLVPAGSNLRAIEDVDREGIRVSITSKSAYDLFLSRDLKRATLIHAATPPESIDVFLKQKLDAVAGVRAALAISARQISGSRVLPGHFMTIPQAMGVPKGRPNAARYLREFVESVKASGLVANALKRHGLTADDAIVAAPAK
jgi:polar amino acid transport system substrate-binding protein